MVEVEKVTPRQEHLLRASGDDPELVLDRVEDVGELRERADAHVAARQLLGHRRHDAMSSTTA